VFAKTQQRTAFMHLVWANLWGLSCPRHPT